MICCAIFLACCHRYIRYQEYQVYGTYDTYNNYRYGQNNVMI